MKKLSMLVLATLFTLPMLGATIGVVDVQAVVDGSAPGKAAQVQLETVTSERTKVYDKQQADLKALSQSIQSEKDPAKQAELAATYKAKDIESKRYLEDANRDINDLRIAAGQKLQKSIHDAIVSVAKAKKLDLVLPVAETAYFSDAVDITKDVLKTVDGTK